MRALFEGVIATVNIDPGDPSAAGQGAVMQPVDVSTFHMDLQISDIDMRQISVGQTAQIVAEGQKTQTYIGTVRYIAPTITVVAAGNQRTYLVEVALDEQGWLRPGIQVRVTILTNISAN